MRRYRGTVFLACAAFVFAGLGASVGGVLLLAQMDDYGVGRTAIGATFFTGSAGFVVAGLATGGLMHRLGVRLALVAGTGVYVVAALYLATRPPFLAFVVVQFATGFGVGVLESVLNAYLTELPDSVSLLNRLHGFFGVGALLGPPLAAWAVGYASWTVVWLALAVVGLLLGVGFLVAYPRPPARPVGNDEGLTSSTSGLLMAALRQPAILLGSMLLALYVGLEMSGGNWAFGYLVQGRGQAELAAGYAVSGYWLGLTLGRFIIGPVAARIGLTASGVMLTCLIGVTAAAALTWLLPFATVGLLVLGFFLGPIFPTAMALAPDLAPERLVPTAIGVMNAGSVVGGAVMPWLAGLFAQRVGVWTLMPYLVALAFLQLLAWWPTSALIRARRAKAPVLSRS
jgi:fucose permease